jgi:TetR/AcrR family transcriptional repressor of nem operon
VPDGSQPHRRGAGGSRPATVRAAATVDALAETVTARLTADKESGLLPPDFDPRIVVPIIIKYLQGLFRMALVSYNRPNLEQQIELFLTGLRL